MVMVAEQQLVPLNLYKTFFGAATARLMSCFLERTTLGKI